MTYLSHEGKAWLILEAPQGLPLPEQQGQQILGICKAFCVSCIIEKLLLDVVYYIYTLWEKIQPQVIHKLKTIMQWLIAWCFHIELLKSLVNYFLSGNYPKIATVKAAAITQ